MRTPNRQVQIKRIKKVLQGLWSKAVRERDGNKCLMCGKTEFLHAHHWLFRKGHSLALAFDVRNGAALCYGCHIGRLHHDGDGEFIMRFLELMRNKIGASDIAGMEEIARHPHTLTLEDLQEVHDGYIRKEGQTPNVGPLAFEIEGI